MAKEKLIPSPSKLDAVLLLQKRLLREIKQLRSLFLAQPQPQQPNPPQPKPSAPKPDKPKPGRGRGAFGDMGLVEAPDHPDAKPMTPEEIQKSEVDIMTLKNSKGMDIRGEGLGESSAFQDMVKGQ